jgi:hypothetical protein
VAILVAALIDQGQLLSDKRNDTQLAATDWLTMVNWSVKALWRLITSLDPDAYFDQQDFSLVGGVGQNVFDLATLTGTGATPHAWRALHGVDFRPDTTSRRTVHRRNFQERNKGRIGWWVPGLPCGDRKYDIRGSVLNITPYEIAGGPYRVYYRYAPYLFVSPTDAVALDPQLEPYDEYLAVMTARKALGIEESDQGPMSERLGELIQEITDEHERDDESPAVIADVEDDDYDRGLW